jgi:hypothetical protein
MQVIARGRADTDRPPGDDESAEGYVVTIVPIDRGLATRVEERLARSYWLTSM